LGRWFGESIVVLLVCCLMQPGLGLQLHEGSATVAANTVYNQNLYLQQLSLIQSRFQLDVSSIQATFAQLNAYLNNTNISSSSEIIKLQQTLAQESNALYNIENYLTVPYALKSCECLNFTTAEKAQLQQQIANVSDQILVLQG
jgi:hypothetical protein